MQHDMMITHSPTSPVITLRPYQEECVRRVLDAYQQDRGGEATLVLPTGAGKTLIFCQVIHRLQVNTLIIAHRDELLEQAAEKYRLVKPDAIIGKVGSGRHEYGGEVTVASIATISRPEHLKRLKAIGYGLVIVDESHHSAAAGYQAVLRALPAAFVLKVTATPDRLDGKDSTGGKPPLYSASIVDMIAQGYLCDVKAIAIRTETSLDGLHTEMGDYKISELEVAIDTPARNRRVVEAYQEHAPGRWAICFAVTVAHASHLADAFRQAGVPAAPVCGDTPLEERKHLYQALHEGTLKVLTNVQVLTEGFDQALIDCIIMARPTQSRALFVQAMGRGLRLAPTKHDCLVLDLTDNCLKHRLEPQTLQKALGKALQDHESVLGALAREERQRYEPKGAATTVVRTLKHTRTADRSINLLERLPWQEQPDGTYLLEVGVDKHRIELVPAQGGYSVYACLAPGGERQHWMSDAPLDWAQQYAERQARVLLTKKYATVLVDHHAAWRDLPVNPDSPQAFHLQRFGVPNWWTLTRGEASDILGQHFEAERRERQAEKARAKQQTRRDIA